MFIANVMSYAMVLILGRHLGPADFGGYSALTAYGLVLAVPAGALQVITARHVVATGSDPTRMGLIAGTSLMVLTLIISPVLSHQLTLPTEAVLWLALSVLTITTTGVGQGILLGRSRLQSLSLLYFVTAVSRLGAVLLGWWVGASLTDIFALLALASVFTWGVSHLLSRADRLELTPGPEGLARELFWSTLSLGAFVAMTNVDVLLARSVLTAHESGGYALASTFGRAVCWSTQFIAILLVPRAQASDSRRVIVRGQLIILAIGAMALATIAVSPRFWITLAGGADYQEFSHLALACTGLGVVWALLQVSIFSDIGRGWTALGIATWVAVLLQILLVRSISEPNAWHIVAASASTSTLIVVAAYWRRAPVPSVT